VTNDDVHAFIEEANEINRMLVALAKATPPEDEKRTLLRYLKAHSGRLQALERHVESLEADLPSPEQLDSIARAKA